MINPKELRLDNYVCDIVSGEWMIVDDIGEVVGAVLIDRSKYPLKDGWEMGYITLTPEILEQCGFKKESLPTQDGDCNFWQIDGRFHLEQYIKSGDVFQYCGDDYVIVIYLHQLQNLYFALTGEELRINL